MKGPLKFIVFAIITSLVVSVSCNKKDTSKKGNDSILEGTISVLVDESIYPIVEDEKIVFENDYKATINLIPQSESEVVNSLIEGKSSVLVLSRKLTTEETKTFSNKKITPRISAFATDAVVFIRNNKSNDTLLKLTDVVNFLKGQKNTIKGLVFDNPNSSTTRYLSNLAQIDKLPEEGVYSFKTSEEVLSYVEKNDGMIGVVGLNWLTQPTISLQPIVENLKILSVQNKQNEYIFPSQDNIAQKKYPLARELYIINCQGYEGLGMGFSSFVGGEIGQRIILKSGLVPVRFPSRQIVTRKQIESK